MAEPLSDVAAIAGYHAHIYFEAARSEEAAALRGRLAAAFPAALLGRWHERPVGPHPAAMYQLAFAAQDFARIVPWLMLNRGALTILVHPNTEDEYADHAHHALWLGEKLPLKLDVLRKGNPTPR
ncbi:MAG TPA: DOPA 4,5-dioxygenase family protein [Stellaceae bacterium]|nr:DOPA 4,5-dioxygenase family protein [Stellaceae bacterium]